MKRTESNSSISTARGCLRKYKHLYVDQIKADKPKKDVISFGCAGHDAMEAHYASNPLHEPYSFDPLVDAKVVELLHAHLKHYNEDEKNWKVLAVEYEFQVQFINPDTGRASTNSDAVGKVDLIVEINGAQWIVDHKFTSTFKPREYWMVNSQADMYINVLNKNGYNIKGVIWNEIRTPSIRPKQVGKKELKHLETIDEYCERLQADIQADPSKYFHRETIKRWEDDIDESMRDAWLFNQCLNECHRTGKFPRNSSHCFYFNSPCEFLPLCAYHTSTEDVANIEGFIKKEKKHEELEGF